MNRKRKQINIIIEDAKGGSKRAQKDLYDIFSPYIYGICIRYMSDEEEAKDCLIRSLYKGLTCLDQLNNPSSIRSWWKTIAVRECLTSIKKNSVFKKISLGTLTSEIDYHEPSPISHLSAEEIKNFIQQLPLGSRTVFNLYVIEGYSHSEIAAKLNIKIGSSKSQLHKAKEKLKNKLNPLNIIVA